MLMQEGRILAEAFLVKLVYALLILMLHKSCAFKNLYNLQEEPEIENSELLVDSSSCNKN